MDSERFLLAVAVLLMALLNNVECLNCVRCSSITDRSCLWGDVQPTNCSENKLYCIKYEGFVKGGRFVVRDCVGADGDTTGCTMKTVENQNVKVCVSICNTDGCNIATRTHPATTVVLIFALVTIVRHFDDT